MMRGIAGPTMMLVVVVGFFVYRAMSDEKSPSRSFMERELAGADADLTGSCYSLSTVLIANGFWGDVPRHWEFQGKDAWTFVVEDIQSGSAGPVHRFQKFRFEARGDDAVRLAAVDASEGFETGVKKTIDSLLQAPNTRESTPVDRCRGPGASGYHFEPKR